MTPSAQRL
jgi:hypothetical protein